MRRSWYTGRKKGRIAMRDSAFSAGHADEILRVEDYQTVSQLFKQLGDASRLRIFWLLCHNEVCGTELAAIVEMTPPAVAHHLRLLRSSHLLVSRREGKEVYYRAADTAQAQAMHHMIEEMMEISCPQGRGEEDCG